MTTFVSFLVIFTVIVSVHELGHYLAAKSVGIKVYEFSIGFPFSPKVLTLFRFRETAFTVRLLPLGGFVRFSSDFDGEGKEFLSAHRHKRALVAASGALFNIVFAVLLLTAIFCFYKDMGLSAAIARALSAAADTFTGVFHLIVSLFTGKASFDNLIGPVGIAVMSGKAAEAGAYGFFFFASALSLSLGVLNLLPLPALDGGQLVVLAVEAIRKKDVPKAAHEAVWITGIALILSLTAITTYKDVLRLIA